MNKMEDKTYKPQNQYRCTIIRGKAKSDLDNLLPKYASIINELCPCSKELFDTQFNEKLNEVVGGTKKTLDNHRTEIAYKLFGMYFIDENNMVFPSERTLSLLEDQDQPKFFKDICFRFQFPNGMDSSHNLGEKLNNNISIRQFIFLIKLLSEAEKGGVRLLKNEIAFFVLNSADVLEGTVTPNQVLAEVLRYRRNDIEVRVKIEGKASSYSMQHINEQLNLLELANLIRVSDEKRIYLNPLERETIEYFISQDYQKLDFDIYKYNFDSEEGRKKLYYDWQIYFASVDKEGLEKFETSVDALQFSVKRTKKDIPKAKSGKVELGDDGELFVYEYEKSRVEKYDKRLVNKIHLLGKTKGLGYDIQSIFADGSDISEFVHYIEVKATKRMTLPEETEDRWIDSISLTRNEWVAAEQHSKSFSIYRVYFTPDKTVVYAIRNPYDKNQLGEIKCIPTNYRLDFSTVSIDFMFEK